MKYNMEFSVQWASVYIEADSEEEAEKKLNEGVYITVEPKSGIEQNDGGEIEVHYIDEQ
jgi:DNA-dependent RNA polymerase auxiliary subunit epsilon